MQMTLAELEAARQRIAERRRIVAELEASREERRKQNQYGTEPLVPSAFMRLELETQVAKRRMK
jgi:hypothetical protein